MMLYGGECVSRSDSWCQVEACRGVDVPRLSAAMTTPSLYFTATTLVPVTMGCWVCCVGPSV